MAKPTRFYVQWDMTRNPDVDPLDLRMENVGDNRAEAVRLAESISRKERICVQVIERTEIEDVTPPEDPPGLIWDWAEDWENVEDVFVDD